MATKLKGPEVVFGKGPVVSKGTETRLGTLPLKDLTPDFSKRLRALDQLVNYGVVLRGGVRVEDQGLTVDGFPRKIVKGR